LFDYTEEAIGKPTGDEGTENDSPINPCFKPVLKMVNQFH
jgi:hypothetical protein